MPEMRQWLRQPQARAFIPARTAVVVFLVLDSKNEVRRFLRLRRCLHNQLFVVLQLLEPALQIGGGIFEGAFLNPRLATKKGRAHFGNQFLLAIRIRAKAFRFRTDRNLLFWPAQLITDRNTELIGICFFGQPMYLTLRG